jgi:hypothetical protein
LSEQPALTQQGVTKAKGFEWFPLAFSGEWNANSVFALQWLRTGFLDEVGSEVGWGLLLSASGQRSRGFCLSFAVFLQPLRPALTSERAELIGQSLPWN